MSRGRVEVAFKVSQLRITEIKRNEKENKNRISMKSYKGFCSKGKGYFIICNKMRILQKNKMKISHQRPCLNIDSYLLTFSE